MYNLEFNYKSPLDIPMGVFSWEIDGCEAYGEDPDILFTMDREDHNEKQIRLL